MANRRMKVSFTLDEKDIAYFQGRFKKAKRAARSQDEDEVKAQARALVESIRAERGVPHFVLESVSALEDLVALVDDDAYKAPKLVVNKVIAALAYFADPDDLIPDEIPVLGFLDDAIMIKVVETEFKHELAGYRKFRKFLRGAEQRPWTQVARVRLPGRIDAESAKLREEFERKQKADEKKGLGIL